jgi:hypothetical protein
MKKEIKNLEKIEDHVNIINMAYKDKEKCIEMIDSKAEDIKDREMMNIILEKIHQTGTT